jgi:hypothetical protein
MLSQAELETEGSSLATIIGLPPTPLLVCFRKSFYAANLDWKNKNKV